MNMFLMGNIYYNDIMIWKIKFDIEILIVCHHLKLGYSGIIIAI